MKEFFRKKLVALKRRPQIIAGVVLVVSFLIYALKLRVISDTTARINTAGMGLCGFVTMLFSILSFVCFLNSFPRRKKANIPMLVLFFLMQGAIIFCDFIYYSRVKDAILAEIAKGTAAEMFAKNPFVRESYNMLQIHMVSVIVTLALTALVPVYGKLLRKINTSVEVEGNEDIAAIEIASED